MFQETVFHVISPNDLSKALKYTCDYRRYSFKSEGLHYYNKQPYFFDSVKKAITKYGTEIATCTEFLVISKITGICLTQSDYYVRYVVSC